MPAAILLIVQVVALGLGALATLAGAVLAVAAAPTNGDVGFHPRTIGCLGATGGLFLFTGAACALLGQLRP